MNKKTLPKAMRPLSAEPSAVTERAAPVAPASPLAVEEPKAAPADADARRARAMKMVEYFSSYAGVAGLIPVPFLDLAAIGGLQFQMLRRLSHVYEVPFSNNRGKALIAAIAGTMIPASSGIGAASATKGVPLVGSVVSAFVVPTLAAGATYGIGMAFIKHFAGGGTLLDFNPPDYREFLKVEAAKRRAGGKAAASQTT